MSRHKVVMVSAPEIFAWSRKWPGSGMADKDAVAFTYEGNGSLVDIEPYGWDEGVDGAAVVALSQDAQQGLIGTVVGGAHGTPLRGTPHVRGNPRRVGESRGDRASRVLSRLRSDPRLYDEKMGPTISARIARASRAGAKDWQRRREEWESRAYGASRAIMGNPPVPGSEGMYLVSVCHLLKREGFSVVRVGDEEDSIRTSDIVEAVGHAESMDHAAIVFSHPTLGRVSLSCLFQGGTPEEVVYDYRARPEAAKIVERVLVAASPRAGAAIRGRANPGDVHIDIHSHNARGGRARAVANVRVIARWKDASGQLVELFLSGMGYRISGPGFAGRVTASSDADAMQQVQRLVDRDFDGRVSGPLTRVSAEGEAKANPAAAVSVEIRGDGSDWIRMLSFFQRHRRGSEARFAHNTVLRTKSTGVAGSDDVEVVLHATPIVTFHADGTMTLNSGGYRTATTKARINAMLPPGVHLAQVKGKWLLRSGGDAFPFFDGMRFGVQTFPHGHSTPG